MAYGESIFLNESQTSHHRAMLNRTTLDSQPPPAVAFSRRHGACSLAGREPRTPSSPPLCSCGLYSRRSRDPTKTLSFAIITEPPTIVIFVFAVESVRPLLAQEPAAGCAGIELRRIDRFVETRLPNPVGHAVCAI